MKNLKIVHTINITHVYILLNIRGLCDLYVGITKSNEVSKSEALVNESIIHGYKLRDYNRLLVGKQSISGTNKYKMSDKSKTKRKMEKEKDIYISI